MSLPVKHSASPGRGKRAAGRLVRPFDLSLKIASDFAYYLVVPKAKADKPMIRK